MNDWIAEVMVSRGERYKVLADGLEKAIRGGQLGVGSRLPTHRELARKLSISVSTVTRAYVALRERGLIQGTVGRGSFVRATPALAADPSPPIESRAPETALEGLFAPLLHGQGLVDLAFNYPAPSTAARCVREGMADALRDSDVRLLAGFESPAGEFRQKEDAVAWLRGLDVPVRVDSTFLVPGAQGGLSTILVALCRPGQIVLTEALSWPGFTSVAASFGVKVETVESDQKGLIPDSLERICRTVAPRLLYTMPTLHNPTTLTTPTERKRELARIARRHELIIVEDDAYGFLLDERPLSYFELLPRQTIYLASLSKVIAPSLRIAYAAAQPDLLRRLLPALRVTTMAVSPLLAELASRLIGSGLAREAARAQSAIALRRQRMAARLFGEEERSVTPSMHRWVPVGPHWNTMSFVVAALREGVSVAPGSLFSPTPGLDPGAVRVCLCGEPNEHRLEAALATLGKLLSGTHVARRTA
jgi:DNA-binding transcriptional MocR family regulator